MSSMTVWGRDLFQRGPTIQYARGGSATRVTAVLALAALYAVAFAPLHSELEFAAGIFSTAPVLLASWFFGARVGLLAGVLTLPVNVSLVWAVGADSVEFLRSGGVLGSVTAGVVGFFIGRLREFAARAMRAEAQVEAQLAELHRLSERLVNSQEDERKRVAMELHDGPLQTALYLLNGSHVSRNEELLRRLVSELRATMTLLRPSILDDLGLVATLQWLVQDMTEKEGLTLGLSLDGIKDEDRFSPLVEVGMFRVAQEAVTNVRKHSGARDVDVSLSKEGRSLVLVVADNGIGFEVDSQAGRGLGIAGMRERIRELGGHLEVRAASGRGTDVVASVPLER
jgi:signal transduction histidine kinase